MKRSTSRIAVAAAAAALAATACAGSDDAAAPPPDTTIPAASAGPPPTTRAARPATTTADGASSEPASTEPASTVPATAAPTTTNIDEMALQTLLDQWRTEVGAYGATLSIRLPGVDDVHLASGVDDRDVTAIQLDGSQIEHSATPMPTDGTFVVQHITKTFVAAVALQLVDEGRLSLDEPVAAWLPELPNADTITLRMLLGYTSGLPPWWEDADYISTLIEDPTRSFSPEELLAEYLQRPPIGPPGGEPVFGGIGYIATGVLIERVLGQDLATVIEERLTGPLSLGDTALSDGSAWPTRHGWLSRPGAADPDRTFDMLDEPSEAVMTTLWAESGMVSTSQDLLDWGEALFTGQVLGEQTTATMLEMNPAKVPPVPNRYFGLGATGYCLQDGCDATQVEIVGAPGSTSFGWSCQLAHHLDSGTTIVVQANIAAADPAQLIELPIKVIEHLGL